MWHLFRLVTILGIVTTFTVCESSRILCLFTTPSYSHQVSFRGLTLALNKRGHELVVLTPNPINDSNLMNYKEIYIQYPPELKHPENMISIRKRTDLLEVLSRALGLLASQTEFVLNIPEFKKIYAPDSNERFDLVIIEMIIGRPFYPLVKRFEAPWIGICSLGLGLNEHYALGNPIMSSHPGTWELGRRVNERLTFFNRMKNYISAWKYIYCLRTSWLENYEKLARKYFGDYGSTLTEIENNMSLALVDEPVSISYPRPNVPQIIDIGGGHVQRSTEPLPENLKKILDDAENGFVYMSLGSTAKSEMMSEELRGTFLKAFSKLPYTFIWKYEADDLTEKPSNVHTIKWAPQQSILAHPNAKAFVYQGGRQSTQEAVNFGVPMIGLPILGDQDGQILKMVSLGVCERLEITDLHSEELIRAITTIVTDNRYKQRMLHLRSIMRDSLQEPTEIGVWWVEHVIRNRGASHLRSLTADLPWYQRGDIDLVAFITTMCLISTVIILIIIHRTVLLVIRSCPASKKDKTT